MMQKKSLLFSGFFHLALLAAVLFHLQNSMTGKNALKILDAYIYQPRTVKTQTQKIAVVKKHSLVLPDKNQPATKEQKLFRPSEKMNSFSQGSENELLEHLHQLIAAKQRYPQDAFALGQTGDVKVGFILAPDGTLSAIHVVNSSGIGSLDQAALASVQAISPCVEAQHYLHAPSFFSIDIDFI